MQNKLVHKKLWECGACFLKRGHISRETICLYPMVEVMLIALLMLLLDLSVDRLIEGLSVYVGNSASNLIP